MTITLDGTNGVTTAGITLGSTAIASTGAEINILDGVTSTAAELNILDGVTSTTAELNILDGVTSTTAELNILDGVTSTTAELNILDGVTATAAEINLIDGGATIGTTAVADGDGILINDGGTMRVSTVQTVKTYMTAGVGTSTDHGAVGTYIIGRPANYTNYAPGATASSLKVTSIFRNNQAGNGTIYDNTSWDTNVTPTSVSGTWRAMSHCSYISSNTGGIGLWVRTA